MLDIRHRYYVVTILLCVGICRRQVAKLDILSNDKVDCKELVLIQIY